MYFNHLGPVVQKPISTKLGLNFNTCSCFQPRREGFELLCWDLKQVFSLETLNSILQKNRTTFLEKKLLLDLLHNPVLKLPSLRTT